MDTKRPIHAPSLQHKEEQWDLKPSWGLRSTKRCNTDPLWWTAEVLFSKCNTFPKTSVTRPNWELYILMQCKTFMICSLVCVSISTHCLVVEGHHLAAYVPKELGAVIGWVNSCSFGVNPAHLPLIVSEKNSSGSTVLYLNVNQDLVYFGPILCQFQPAASSQQNQKRILYKIHCSLGNHCLPLGLHERWDDVTLVFFCTRGKDCEKHWHVLHWKSA